MLVRALVPRGRLVAVPRQREARRWLEGRRRRAQRAVELRLPELVAEEGREAVAKRLQLSEQVPVQTEVAAVRTEMEAGEARSSADWIHRKGDGRKNAESFRFELEDRHSGAD